jgi:hypothetical protein
MANSGIFGKVIDGQIGLIRVMRDAKVPEEYIPFECPQENDEGERKVEVNTGDIVSIRDAECSNVSVANILEYDENIGSGSNVSLTNNDCPNNNSGNNSGNVPIATLQIPKSCYCERIPIGGSLITSPRMDDCKRLTYQNYAVEYYFGRFIWADDAIVMNMTMHHFTNNQGFQTWYPSGGAWIGLHGFKTKKWYWYNGTDPYQVIRGGPPFYTYFPPPSQVTTTPAGEVYCTDGGSGASYYRVDNFMAHFNLPSNEAVDAVHISISNNSSLIWLNYVKASLNYFSLCRMNPASPFTRIFDDAGDDLVTRNKDIAQPKNPDKRFPTPGKYPEPGI